MFSVDSFLLTALGLMIESQYIIKKNKKVFYK